MTEPIRENEFQKEVKEECGTQFMEALDPIDKEGSRAIAYITLGNTLSYAINEGIEKGLSGEQMIGALELAKHRLLRNSTNY